MARRGADWNSPARFTTFSIVKCPTSAGLVAAQPSGSRTAYPSIGSFWDCGGGAGFRRLPAGSAERMRGGSTPIAFCRMSIIWRWKRRAAILSMERTGSRAPLAIAFIASTAAPAGFRRAIPWQILVEPGLSLASVVDYIHLNPVLEGLVSWSKLPGSRGKLPVLCSGQGGPSGGFGRG